MIDIEESAATIADEIGSDLVYLQPVGEKRFDPATLTVVVGLWLLRSVADGISDGIKEEAEAGTRSLVGRIAGAVTSRTRRNLPTAMASASHTADLDAAKGDADAAWKDARGALAEESDTDRARIAETAAGSAAAVLAEAGLPTASAERVEIVVRIEVERLLAGP